MLRSWEKAANISRCPPSTQPAKPADEAWYVLHSEVETAAAAAAQALAENRRVTFTPPAPVAGQPLLVHRQQFPHPEPAEMGHGRRHGTDQRRQSRPRCRKPPLAYAYAARRALPGQGLRRQRQCRPSAGRPAQVTVSAYPRSLQVTPEQPLANHPVAITALQFPQLRKRSPGTWATAPRSSPGLDRAWSSQSSSSAMPMRKPARMWSRPTIPATATKITVMARSASPPIRARYG